LRSGEIVINRVNSREYLGKTALVPELAEPTVFESNMMRFDVDRGRLHPRYLIHFLQTDYVHRHFQQAAKDAVNQSSINQQDVKALPVIVPPISLQDRFVRVLDKLDTIRFSIGRSLEALDELFTSLQQSAFMREL
jgi:type I restriction enzyme S subunit